MMESDTETPLVSVITPSYNQGRFIEETIQSVLTQSYKNIEHIVVDGGSTDNTLDILKKYEGRLRWISEKDRGQADAVDKGFNMSHGDILAWLNSDDTYLPDSVMKVAEHFKANPETGMVYGKNHFINDRGDIVGNYPTEPFNYKKLAQFTFITQPSTFFKRNVYFDVGGLNQALHFTMDYDLWVRIAQKYRVEYLPVFLSTYRLHTESKTISDIQSLKFQEEYLETVMKYYNWAPVNRIFGYSFHLAKSKMPPGLAKHYSLVVIHAIFSSIKHYFHLNKGIRCEDIRMISPHNIKKLIKGWELKDLIK